MKNKRISFIGAGNMSNAIISGLVKNGYPASAITATCRTAEKRQMLSDTYQINASDDNIAAVKQADVVILCVKPQMMADLCQTFDGIDFSDKLVISIAAGINTERLFDMLNCKPALVRVMPNTPSLVGLGMSGLFATSTVSPDHKAFTEQLFSSVGKVAWVEQESQINAIIAAAGSAPAYFFLFLEAMQAEAINQGFDKDTARMLVQQAGLGAMTMVEQNPQLELSTLREQVTSKGGTTAEALRTFNEANLSETVANAMQAAVKRAEEMEKEL